MELMPFLSHSKTNSMIYNTHIHEVLSKELYTYLSCELNLTDNAINLGIKQSHNECAPISIILWNLGLINLDQYRQLLDWKIKHA